MGAGSVVAVLGVVLLILAMVLFVPVFLMTMGAVAGLLGTFLKSDAEERFEGSELVELNR